MLRSKEDIQQITEIRSMLGLKQSPVEVISELGLAIIKELRVRGKEARKKFIERECGDREFARRLKKLCNTKDSELEHLFLSIEESNWVRLVNEHFFKEFIRGKYEGEEPSIMAFVVIRGFLLEGPIVVPELFMQFFKEGCVSSPENLL